MKTTELNDTLFKGKSFEFQPLTSYIRYIGIEEVSSGICKEYTEDLYRNLYEHRLYI